MDKNLVLKSYRHYYDKVIHVISCHLRQIARLKSNLFILTIRSWWHLLRRLSKEGLASGLGHGHCLLATLRVNSQFSRKLGQVTILPKTCEAKSSNLMFYQKSSLPIQRQTFITLWKLFEAKRNKSLTYARSASLGFVGWYAPDINPNNGTALYCSFPLMEYVVWIVFDWKTSKESNIFSYSAGSENVIFIHCFAPLLHLKHLFKDLYAIHPVFCR